MPPTGRQRPSPVNVKVLTQQTATAKVSCVKMFTSEKVTPERLTNQTDVGM